MKELFNSYNIYETGLNILLSVIAGLVRYLDDDKHGKKELFKSLLFATFCGFIALIFLKSDLIRMKFTPNTISLLVASSAFSAKTILKVLKRFANKYKPRV